MRMKSLSLPLDSHGGAVGQCLGNAVHELSGLLARAHDGIGTKFGCVLEHQVERIGACLLAEFAEQGSVAADNSLQARAAGVDD